MPSKSKIEDLSVSDPPSDVDPYATLELSQDATADEIKTAYKKLALRHHPDKAAPDSRDAAHTIFQSIAFAYAILSDPRRRQRYDTTGNTSESLDIDDDGFNWTDFFRAQYADAITSSKIDSFKSEYQGGEEEIRDVLAVYVQAKGKMKKVYEGVMMSNPLDDEERLRGYIDGAIERGEVEAYDAYINESEKSKKRRMDTARREAKEAGEMAQELEKKSRKKQKGSDGAVSGDLAALIQQRQQGRANTFLDDLEAKYAPKAKPKKRTRRQEVEPPEEAFQRNAAKAQKTRKRKLPPPVEDDEDADETLNSSEERSEEEEEEEEAAPKKRTKGKVSGKGKPRARRAKV